MLSFLSWLFCGAIGGTLLGAAFLLPETPESVLAGWFAALCFCLMLEGKRPIFGFYFGGAVSHALAFAWIPFTVERFGGFPPPVSIGLFVLFCLLSALQFALAAWLALLASRSALRVTGLALPLAWLTVDVVTPKLFPWEFSYTQVLWSGFAGAAEFVGPRFLSALMFWVAGGALAIAGGGWRGIAKGTVPILVLGITLYYGDRANRAVRAELAEAPKFLIGVVQGNLGLLEKRDSAYLEVNLKTYERLTKEVVAKGAQLVIWPESVVNGLIPEATTDLNSIRACPAAELKTPLLFGGLSYRPRPAAELERMMSALGNDVSPQMRKELEFQFFNTAFGIDSACLILGSYHKRILMPFGEYLPFARTFPALRKLSPNTGNFDRGDRTEPITFSLDAGEQKMKVRAMPLICYEDLIPSMAADASLRGAQILVNMTNDAWYGDSAAPYQHHLLAQWRAIESRRYLIRATNTGFTAVVNPMGRTIVSLPLFSEGSFVEQVALLDRETFVSLNGAAMEYGAAAFFGCWTFIASFFRRQTRKQMKGLKARL